MSRAPLESVTCSSASTTNLKMPEPYNVFQPPPSCTTPTDISFSSKHASASAVGTLRKWKQNNDGTLRVFVGPATDVFAEVVWVFLCSRVSTAEQRVFLRSGSTRWSRSWKSQRDQMSIQTNSVPFSAIPARPTAEEVKTRRACHTNSYHPLPVVSPLPQPCSTAGSAA